MHSTKGYRTIHPTKQKDKIKAFNYQKMHSIQGNSSIINTKLCLKRQDVSHLKSIKYIPLCKMVHHSTDANNNVLKCILQKDISLCIPLSKKTKLRHSTTL